MKKLRYKVIGKMVMLGVVLGLAVGHASSDGTALLGIKKIGVVIGELPHSARNAGITRESLRKGIVAKLQSAGIPVVTAEEMAANPGIPYLLVTIVLGYSKPTYMYTVLVGINEKTSFKRGTEVVTYAMPWWRIMKGEHVGSRGLAKEILVTLESLLNEFADDFFSANPKHKVESK